MYEYKTQPIAHQLEDLRKAWNKPQWARWWEQGVGKTKPTIDEIAACYERGIIDAVVILAPNGVHRNWLKDEFEKHMPDRVMKEVRSHVWYSDKTSTKKHQRSVEGVFYHEGLAVIAMGYDAVMTKKGKDAWLLFLKKRKCFYILDESSAIKTPGSKRTQRILPSSRFAVVLRLLNGTPVDDSPFDVYTQCKMVDPTCWHRYGIRNFTAFKAYFAIYEERRFLVPQKCKNGRTRETFQKCVAFKNLKDMRNVLLSVGSRYTKEVLDLPDKVYSKRYFDATPQQGRVYEELKKNYIALLDSGEEVSADMAMVRMLRLQQILSGYVPSDDSDPKDPEPIPGRNARLDLLLETVEPIGNQGIIWSRFTKDVELIADALGDKAIRCDGTVTGSRRDMALDSFKAGDAQWLVSNQLTPGVAKGQTFINAKTVIYYANAFNLNPRLQSEDRAHRVGQKNTVDYIDLICSGKVDEHIASRLVEKRSVASFIQGDEVRDWLE